VIFIKTVLAMTPWSAKQQKLILLRRDGMKLKGNKRADVLYPPGIVHLFYIVANPVFLEDSKMGFVIFVCFVS
jgi:hypothetical protein